MFLLTFLQAYQESPLNYVLNMKIDEVNLKIVLDGVGSITENDVNLAIASEATIFGYNVRADTTALNLAEKEGIEIKYFGIIYDLLDSIKALIEGSLEPEIKERQFHGQGWFQDSQALLQPISNTDSV